MIRAQIFPAVCCQAISWKEWRAEWSKAEAKVQALTSNVRTLQARVDALQAVIIPSSRQTCCFAPWLQCTPAICPV